MHKILSVVFVALLLSLSSVLALTFNTTNPRQVYSGVSGASDFRTKICEGNSTFLIAWGFEWVAQEINKADYTLYGTNIDTCPSYNCYQGDIACNYNNHTIVTNGYKETGTWTPQAQFGKYNMDSHSFTSLGFQGVSANNPIGNSYSGTYGTSLSKTSNPDLNIWYKVSDDTHIRYSKGYNLGSTMGDGDDTLSGISSVYSPFIDLQAIQCGVYGDGKPLIHVLAMDEDTSLVWDHIFKWTGTALTYIQTIEIGDFEENHYAPYQYQYSSYCDNSQNMLYFIGRRFESDDIVLNRYWIDVLDTRSGYEYHQKLYDTSVITLTGDDFAYPSVMKSSNGYVFIGYIDSGSGTFNILEETNYCYPNQWTDAGCLNDKLKQTRTFTPLGCSSDTIRFIDSQYCSEQYNNTHGIYNQGYQTWSNSTSCETDWIAGGSGIKAECYINPLSIPSQCLNTNVTQTLTPTIEFTNTWIYSGWKNYNYSTQNCNPTTNCVNNDWSCGSINTNNDTSIIERISSSYVVTGYGSLTVNPSCTVKLFGGNLFGINRYKLGVSVTAKCNIACKHETFCIDNYYIGERQSDCSYNTTNVNNPCTLGCSNGVCLTTENTNIINNIFNDPIEKLFSGVENLFHLSLTSKFVLWSLFTGLVTFGASKGLDSYKHLAKGTHTLLTLIALGLMIVVGTIIGWYQIWIIITISLIALIVVVLKH